MPEITPPEIDAYVEAHTTPHPQFMRALTEETHAQLPVPQMLSGLVEGRFLEMLVHVAGARRVLELGTFSGHSALAMAAALAPGGRIVTCELSDEIADFAQRHIGASPFADRIELRRGPALDILATLQGPFDLVFIDADKSNYLRYFEACLPMLSDHGLLVFDNTLWGGRVLGGADGASEETRALRELNDRLVRDERVVCVQLPIRDGVTLVRRA